MVDPRGGFEWLGKDMRTRGAHDEAIEIIRLVCTGEFVEYHGKQYDFDRLMVRPAASRSRSTSVGCPSPGCRRAARLADGWISVVNGADEVAGIVATLDGMRAEDGRDHLPFEIKAMCTDVFDYDGFRRLEDAGVTDIMVCPWYYCPGRSVDARPPDGGLERFGDEVIAAGAEPLSQYAAIQRNRSSAGARTTSSRPSPGRTTRDRRRARWRRGCRSPCP